ncbi:hypothetical protein [Sandaracinus amylolyticus]|uniref:Lipoprotein n=1 Tax=Sandaracinus amylolyticus TaxID=927083 RepID=A0A0F6YN57_9BACT|nr:hypothetical protein [Sandaracinus amylolyticus]AKF10916.1 hypothetical protein DB32_008065 [Sandaracinus amylolyticus]
MLPTSIGNARCAAALAALVLAGCGGAAAHRYPLRDPMWVDDDRRPFAPEPEEQYNSWIWDAVDNTTFRQLAELWEYEETREAINVNSVDEVPSSSWFENRIGQRPVSLEEITEGACAGQSIPEPPWTIVEHKAQGTTPGFVIEVDGQRYLFKTDIRVPELTTAADSIATRIFHAIGYSTPCNRVVSFTPDMFVIAPGTMRNGYSDQPMTQADLEEVVNAALRTDDGRFRGSLSRYIDGDVLGGWRFDGRRDDDPNDVVPHEHRREIRGMYVLSAWLNHIDSRAENNFDAWVTTDGTNGYVQHYILDVGDSFGLIWERSDPLTRRFGHSHYVDLEHIGVDLFTLGLLDRPYREEESDRPHPVFTYYNVEDFDPDAWRNGYPNPGFERRTERDMAWMTRIISQFRDEHLRALVATGQFSEPSVARDLERILRGRQRKIFERYLTRLSPLAFPQIVSETDRTWLCMRDLAIETGIRDAWDRRHRATAWLDWPAGPPAMEIEQRRTDEHVCALLPDLRVRAGAAPRYLVIDVVASTPGRETTGAVSVHLYQTGPREYRVVGLRRLDPP